MRHISKAYLLLVAAAGFTACGEPVKKAKALDKFEWLEGSWEGVTEEVTMRESWTKVSDELMTADAYVLAGTDTVFREYVKLRAVNDSTVHYIVYIQGVPDSTSFVLVKYENDEALFENPEHDFPQRVVYKKMGIDSLNAYIEGQVDGKTKREEFPYKRVSSPPKEDKK
jgi:hypothetical protein